MKIALYKAFGCEGIWEVEAHRERENSPYIRTTEIEEIQFHHLPVEVTVPKELAQLNEMERVLTEKYTQELGAVQAKRRDLLALAPPTLVAEVA